MQIFRDCEFIQFASYSVISVHLKIYYHQIYFKTSLGYVNIIFINLVQ